MEEARDAAERRADAAIAQAREDARIRVADLEAQLAAERCGREADETHTADLERQLVESRREATTAAQHLAAADARATALEGERDRLVTQLQRDTDTLAALARTAEAAEGRAAALDAQLADLRRQATQAPGRPTRPVEEGR
jgi:chromosome segregation ATPase